MLAAQIVSAAGNWMSRFPYFSPVSLKITGMQEMTEASAFILPLSVQQLDYLHRPLV